MSSVTTVILLTELLDEDRKLADIHAAMARAGIRGEFRHLNKHFGGTKAPQMEVFGGAFNYLYTVHLIEALRSVDWEPGDVVQLVINGEHDTGARLYDVLGKCDAKWEIERDFPCDADGNRMED